MVITKDSSCAVVEQPTGQESLWRPGVAGTKAVFRQSAAEITTIDRVEPHLGPTLAERLEKGQWSCCDALVLGFGDHPVLASWGFAR